VLVEKRTIYYIAIYFGFVPPYIYFTGYAIFTGAAAVFTIRLRLSRAFANDRPVWREKINFSAGISAIIRMYMVSFD
jgi:hypothetical protein